MRTRRSFTPEFKARIVLDLLTGTKWMVPVCGEYDLKEQVVLRWKTEFLARTASVFASD